VTSRRLATALVAAVLPLALAACGSGRSPHTYEERPTVDAAQASLGSLQLRNITIAAPAAGTTEIPVGGVARATMAIVSTGTADRLINVSSPAATSVVLVGTAAQTGTVAVPRLGMVAANEFAMELRGLTQAVRPGESVEMTFVFEDGGRQTLRVPVATHASPEAPPSENPFEGTHGAEG
jgi:copper(I)-binding protein